MATLALAMRTECAAAVTGLNWCSFVERYATSLVHGMSKERLRLFQGYHDTTMSEVERRLGNGRLR
jgi:hypothetical protein